jgi:hypothetical protein
MFKMQMNDTDLRKLYFKQTKIKAWFWIILNKTSLSHAKIVTCQFTERDKFLNPV